MRLHCWQPPPFSLRKFRKTYKRLRAADLKLTLPERTAKTDEREESIGPYQMEDNMVWLWNRYDDSEGLSGVGAFGFFDKATRRGNFGATSGTERYGTKWRNVIFLAAQNS